MSVIYEYFIPDVSHECANCNVHFNSEFEEYIHLCDYCIMCGKYNCTEHIVGHAHENFEDNFSYFSEGTYYHCTSCLDTGISAAFGTPCHDCQGYNYYDGYDSPEYYDQDDDREYGCEDCREMIWGICRSCRNAEEDW